jgi:predicted transposase YbfD/YdcC
MPSHSLQYHLSIIPDPRRNRTRRHDLVDILTIAVCAMLCGAETFVDMAQFGREKQAWFEERLQLRGGIPSHDTFNRVFRHLDPERFKEAFANWIMDVQQTLKERQREGELKDQIIALDGKTLRRSFDKVTGQSAIHMVSAFSAVNSLVLGQVKVDQKSNEITAIPALLSLLDVQGCIVTIDAMGTQKEIARQIVEQQGDYVLALKENHPTLYDSVKRFFDEEQKAKFQGQPYEVFETVEKGHGRIEKRRHVQVDLATTDPEGKKWLDPNNEWKGLTTIVMVERERTILTVAPEQGSTPDSTGQGQEPAQKTEKEKSEKTSREVRYYISSLPQGVERVAQAVRSHWSIENKLHWVLDIAFREDECRTRKDHAAENLAILRHIVLNLLKQEKTAKVGVPAKRRKAAWSLAYMELLLAG